MRIHFVTTHVSNILRLMMIPILLFGLFGFSPSPAYADTYIYVNKNANGANNGTSWANAYTDLQSALSPAPPAGTEIWVAAGTYIPGTAQADTFTLINGVAIYGGFDGTESTRDERDPKGNVTVLSGELGLPSDTEDNIYHVVTASGTNSTAILDGFTITGGNATEDPSAVSGGGILNVGGSPVISHMIISENEGYYGGGMFNYNGASPTVTNVTFINNTAQRGGGMYNNLNTNTILTNVTFIGNFATGRGGGMTTANSSPTLTNVTFYDNVSPKGGAIHNADNGSPTLINVTFNENEAYENGGSIYNEDSSSPEILNSILYGNATGGQVEIYNDVTSSTTVNQSILGGTCSTGTTCTNVLDQDPLLGPLADNGGYTQTLVLGAGSPAIDAASDADCPAEDQRGYSRPQGIHCDMGAVEVDNQPPDTTIDSSPSDPSSDNTPTFTFSGDDLGGSGVASFQCQMDGGGFSACTSPFTSPALSSGSHTFEVYAVDQLANADPSPASYTWQLDFTPTNVLSSLRADASPTSQGSVDFTVTFSANVSGVAESDFALTTSGVSGAAISGVSGSGSTYTVSVSTGSGDGTIRLDIPASADLQDPNGNQPVNLPYTSGESYKIIKNGTFADVPNTYWAWRWIESFYDQGITTGCTLPPLHYCPERQVTRAEMAVFILRAKFGSDYLPSPTQTDIFADVPVAGKAWMQPWIEQFYEEGITTGCIQSPLKYCPERQVTRAEMAVFILRAKYGSDYLPSPTQTDIFADVPVAGKEWMQPWIEQFYEEGITVGCTQPPNPKYCPERPVTRAEMAVFIDRAFNIPPLP